MEMVSSTMKSFMPWWINQSIFIYFLDPQCIAMNRLPLLAYFLSHTWLMDIGYVSWVINSRCAMIELNCCQAQLRWIKLSNQSYWPSQPSEHQNWVFALIQALALFPGHSSLSTVVNSVPFWIVLLAVSPGIFSTESVYVLVYVLLVPLSQTGRHRFGGLLALTYYLSCFLLPIWITTLVPNLIPQTSFVYKLWRLQSSSWIVGPSFGFRVILFKLSKFPLIISVSYNVS